VEEHGLLQTVEYDTCISNSDNDVLIREISAGLADSPIKYILGMASREITERVTASPF
jgi:hypothetical protein